MRIALDVRPLQNESGSRGVGRYVRALLANLPAAHDDYLYLESRWAAPGDYPAGAHGRRVRLVRPSRAITLFDQAATPAICAARKVDLLHSTFYALPRLSPRRTLRVITVHDLIPLRVPGATGAKNTAIFREIYRSARWADAVIVPSARTASDLLEEVGVERGRVHVIPMGVGPPFGRPEATAAVAGIGAFQAEAAGPGSFSDGTGPFTAPAFAPASGNARSSSTIARLKSEGARVLVYAGGFDRTKNVPFLIDALERVKDPRVRLALVGDHARARESMEARKVPASVRDRIVLLGRLDDDDLADAYRSADVFVSASLYEGFGLPPLEAMACGCPVVSLDTGAVPEVLEGASVRVEGRDPEAFAGAVREVLDDPGQRRALVARGLERAESLGWDRTARATHDLYHRLGSRG